MAKVQTRRSVSLNRDVYVAALRHALRSERALSLLVTDALRAYGVSISDAYVSAISRKEEADARRVTKKEKMAKRLARPKKTNAEVLRDLRIKAVAAGKCTYCRCRRASRNRKTCRRCRRYHSELRRAYANSGLCQHGRVRPCRVCKLRTVESNRRRRLRKLADRTCTNCSQPAIAGKRMCKRHARMHNARTKVGTAERVRLGFCRTAKSHGAPVNGTTFCRRCLRSLSEYGKRYRGK